MEKKIHFGDGLEILLAQYLTDKGIEFIHESQDKNIKLDFYLPDFDVYIEVKRYHADRVNRQLALKENVILLQGKKSIEMFMSFITASNV
jgi:hypothetical protein